VGVVDRVRSAFLDQYGVVEDVEITRNRIAPAEHGRRALDHIPPPSSKVLPLPDEPDDFVGDDVLRGEPARDDPVPHRPCERRRRRESRQNPELVRLVDQIYEVIDAVHRIPSLRPADGSVLELVKPHGEVLGRQPRHRLAEPPDSRYGPDERTELFHQVATGRRRGVVAVRGSAPPTRAPPVR
jgi:hypothetical protein